MTQEMLSKEALEALQGSIAKWEDIVAGTGYDDGGDNCPLCEVFRSRGEGDEYCDGCPVKVAAGIGGCQRTPYMEWNAHCEETQEFMPYYANSEKEKLLAKAELDFLISLLPRSPA